MKFKLLSIIGSASFAILAAACGGESGEPFHDAGFGDAREFVGNDAPNIEPSEEVGQATQAIVPVDGSAWVYPAENSGILSLVAYYTLSDGSTVGGRRCT